MRIEVGGSTQRKCETMLSTPHIPTDISPRRHPAFMTGGEADAVPGPAQLTAPGHWTLHGVVVLNSGQARLHSQPGIKGMDIYYLKLRCISKRVVSCYEGLNQVR